MRFIWSKTYSKMMWNILRTTGEEHFNNDLLSGENYNNNNTDGIYEVHS